MAFNQSNSGISDMPQDLPFDLRQIYAVEIVGFHLKHTMYYRKSNDYSNYFKSLKDLYIVVRHKIRKKKTTDEEGNEVLAEDRYKDIMKKVIEVIALHEDVYLGTSKDPEGVHLVENALNELEMFLYEMIEEAKMFGGSQRTPGL